MKELNYRIFLLKRALARPSGEIGERFRNFATEKLKQLEDQLTHDAQNGLIL